MKKLFIAIVVIALAGCSTWGMNGTSQSGAQGKKANSQDMTYRGGSK